MEDARQPILDALSKASEQGLRTGFIVNTEHGTIVGTVFPKSANVEPPPRPDRVNAVGTSLGIQEALQALNLESSAELGAKERATRQAPQAPTLTRKPTVVDIDDCASVLARQQLTLTSSGGQSAFAPPSLLRSDLLVNTAAAMRDMRRQGGQASSASFEPVGAGSLTCMPAFQAVPASHVSRSSAPSLTATPTGALPFFHVRGGASPGQPLVATSVDAMPLSQPMIQARGRQQGPWSEQQQQWQQQQQQQQQRLARGPMLSGSPMPTSPRRATAQNGSQSLVELHTPASARGPSPVRQQFDPRNRLAGASYSRCMSARSTLKATAIGASSPEQQFSGSSVDDISQGPMAPAFHGGFPQGLSTLTSQSSNARFSLNGATANPVLRAVSPPRQRSPAPLIQGLSTQPQERVLLRAVSPPRPSPIVAVPMQRQQIGAGDANDDLFNAQSRLLTSLRNTEMYLAKIS